MVSRYVGVVLMTCLAIVSEGLAFAETCPNVVGVWNATIESVIYDSNNDSYVYSHESATYHIVDQNECLFYGNVVFQNDATIFFPITGAIADKKKMVITWRDMTINITLSSYNKNKGLYTKWKFVGYDLDYEDGSPQAVYGTAIRK